MTIRVAINGYGRIGRDTLRALYESNRTDQIQIVAINDLGDAQINAHLTQYDSVHGQFAAQVELDGEDMLINGDRIRILSEPHAEQLPWRELNIDLVYECTGALTERSKAMAHIEAGAKKVLVSAPVKGADATIVYGINHAELKSSHQVISNASCTTNCLAPIAKPLHDVLGINNGLMTTIHAYTNDQHLLDLHHADPYRARSATQSMIPTKTGAAAAVGLVLPELNGRLDGLAVRVPTANVSLVDLTFEASRNTSVEEVNQIIQEAAQGALHEILAINTRPLVSIDFNHNPHSAIFDATQTRVNGRLVKVLAWYDNEWGFSNRMLDNTLAIMNAQ